MKRTFLTCLFVALTLSLSPACTAPRTVAQDSPASAVEGQVASIEGIQDSKNPGFYDIYFPGGTIDDYVKLIREMPVINEDGKSPLNLVVTESARNFRLPEIRIRANYQSALYILESCSSGRENVVVATDDTDEIFIIRLEHNEPIVVNVINAKQILANMEEAALLSAVEIGLEMHDSGSSVTIKLHHETGLLFVKGPSSATVLVQQIVGELGDDFRIPSASGEAGMGGGMGVSGGGKFSGGGGGMGVSGGGTFSGGGGTNFGSGGGGTTIDTPAPSGGTGASGGGRRGPGAGGGGTSGGGAGGGRPAGSGAAGGGKFGGSGSGPGASGGGEIPLSSSPLQEPK